MSEWETALMTKGTRVVTFKGAPVVNWGVFAEFVCLYQSEQYFLSTKEIADFVHTDKRRPRA